MSRKLFRKFWKKSNILKLSYFFLNLVTGFASAIIPYACCKWISKNSFLKLTSLSGAKSKFRNLKVMMWDVG